MPTNAREYKLKFTADGLRRLQSGMAELERSISQQSEALRRTGSEGTAAYKKLSTTVNTNLADLRKQGKVLAGQTSITKIELQKQIEAIKERYRTEIVRARGNAELIKRIEQQKASQVQAINARLVATQAASTGAGGALSGLVGKLRLIGGIAAGAFVVNKVRDFGQAAIRTTAEFETLQTRLNSLYGGVEAGSRAFKRFNEVAATTPFALREVVEAGATLKAFGVDAEANIKVLADLAAFMGVSIPEAASAMGRAFAGGAGAADIFRERGILTLIKTKQGVDDLTKLSLPEFRKAMFDTFNDPTSGIAGATTALSKTIAGLESNLGDAFSRLLNEVGGEFSEGYKNALRGLISITEGFAASLEDSVAATERFTSLRTTTTAQIESLQALTDKHKTLGKQVEDGEDKQSDLNKVMAQIAQIVPGAVAEFDEYGKAVKINTGVVQAFIDVQKDLLRRTEQEAFESLKSDIAEVVAGLENSEKQLAKTQARIELFQSPEGLKELNRELRELTTGRQDFKLFTADDRSLADLQKQADDLAKSSDSGRAALLRFGRELSAFYDIAEDADLSVVQESLKLNEEQFKRIIPAIEAYRKALADGIENPAEKEKEVIKAALQKRLDSLRQQRKQLEIQTDETRTEYDKQIALVTARYDAEINKAGQVRAVVVELEKIKALELLKVWQGFTGKLDSIYDKQKELADKVIDDISGKKIEFPEVRLPAVDAQVAIESLEDIKHDILLSLSEINEVDISSFLLAQIARIEAALRELGTNAAESVVARLDAIKAGFEGMADSGTVGIDELKSVFEELRIQIATLQAESGEIGKDAGKELAESLERLKPFLNDFQSVIETTFAAAFDSGESALDAFADAFKKMLIKMAAQLAASGLLGFLSGDFDKGPGALFGSLIKIIGGIGLGAGTGGVGGAGVGFFGQFGGVGLGKNEPVQQGGPGFNSSPGLFLPDSSSFLERQPTQVTNQFTINAVDGASFESFLRERDGARIISNTLSELL